MARKGLDEGPARARIAAAAITLFAAAVVGASPARGAASESFAAALDHEPPAEWPAFTVAADNAQPRPMIDDGTPGSALKSTNAVSAPLPQAVATGLFMLAGNWIGTHLWKKRKI